MAQQASQLSHHLKEFSTGRSGRSLRKSIHIGVTIGV
jgi:hypothetical protein